MRNSSSFDRHLLFVATFVASFAAGMTDASAQPYDPPTSAFTAYWDVPAFKDFPYKGPAVAKGVLFYSHGVAGDLVQYASPPPEFIKDFARAGWDVVKIQRNNTHEKGWSASGTRHVADLVERVTKAHAQGYRRIIAAGQSYGGAISIEAARKTDLLFGVIATGPGHGSDACGSRAGFSNSRISDNLQTRLAEAIVESRAARSIVVMAANDECQGFNNPTAIIRAALNKAPGQFVFLDDSVPVHGHGSSATSQFRLWYGACLLEFLNPDREPRGKEIACPSPSPVPKFLFPDRFIPPAAKVDGEKSIGLWAGVLTPVGASRASAQEVCVAIESVQGDTMTALVAFGAGAEKKISMNSTRRTLKREADNFVYRQPSNSYQVMVTPGATGPKRLSINSSDGKTTWGAELAPGC